MLCALRFALCALCFILYVLYFADSRIADSRIADFAQTAEPVTDGGDVDVSIDVSATSQPDAEEVS